MPEPSLSTRHRHGSTSRGSGSRAGRTNQYHPHGGRSIRPPSYSPIDEDSEQFTVDAIFSAHSDGLMVILRRAPWIISCPNCLGNARKKKYLYQFFFPICDISRVLLSSDPLSSYLVIRVFGQNLAFFPFICYAFISIPYHCCCYCCYVFGTTPN